MERRQEILYSSENLLVRKSKGLDPDRWVVTFDHYGITGHFDRPGFAEEFLAARGISFLTVLGRGNDWYQYPDIHDALAAARAVTFGRSRVMTYGSSMGGYAAIRFADMLGAHACLAVSPQYSVDRRKVPFEWRWPHDGDRIVWRPELDGVIRCAANPVIIHDPHGEDGLHVHLIARDIACQPIALPHSAHPATTYLQSIGALSDLVLAILHDRFDLAAFTHALDAPRKNDPVYLCELARRQPVWRPELGIALARRALERAPNTDLMFHVLASKLVEAGRYREALPLHARAAELSGDLLCYALPHAWALAQSGDIAAALTRVGQLAVRHPDDAYVHHVLGRLLATSQRRREAVAMARYVCRLSPDDPFYRAVLIDYRRTRLRRWVRRLWQLAGKLRDRLAAPGPRDSSSHGGRALAAGVDRKNASPPAHSPIREEAGARDRQPEQEPCLGLSGGTEC